MHYMHAHVQCLSAAAWFGGFIRRGPLDPQAEPLNGAIGFFPGSHVLRGELGDKPKLPEARKKPEGLTLVFLLVGFRGGLGVWGRSGERESNVQMKIKHKNHSPPLTHEIGEGDFDPWSSIFGISLAWGRLDTVNGIGHPPPRVPLGC